MFITGPVAPENACRTRCADFNSIGIWIMKEADAIRLGTSRNYAGRSLPHALTPTTTSISLQLQNYGIDGFAKHLVAAAANRRPCVDLVHDVLVRDFTFISKEEDERRPAVPPMNPERRPDLSQRRPAAATAWRSAA